MNRHDSLYLGSGSWDLLGYLEADVTEAPWDGSFTNVGRWIMETKWLGLVCTKM